MSCRFIAEFCLVLKIATLYRLGLHFGMECLALDGVGFVR